MKYDDPLEIIYYYFEWLDITIDDSLDRLYAVAYRHCFIVSVSPSSADCGVVRRLSINECVNSSAVQMNTRGPIATSGSIV